MTYYGYLRVSTLDQAENGNGLLAQLASCEAYAGRMGEPIALWFRDVGVSGATGLEDRAGLVEALGDLSPGDVLVVAKRDRLGRDPIRVAMIERAVTRKGARIVSAAGEGTEGDDPSNVLMRRMIDAFAEYERLIIGARTKAALQAKKGKRELIGAVPYGYELDYDGKSLVPNPEEQWTVKEAQRLRNEGLSYRAVAGELTRLGFKSRVGKPFGPKQVWAMTRRPIEQS